MKDKGVFPLLLIGAAAMVSVFILYLVGFFPGMMTQDSIDQWAQIVTFKFNDWHPVMHTLFIYLCTVIWNSPASMVIVQIAVFVSVYLSGIYSLRKFGVGIPTLFIAMILFTLYPTNGFMAVTLWKDILYSIMLLWLTILLMNIAATKGKWIESPVNKVLFFINSLAILFFRHNGILTFLFVMVILAFAYSDCIGKWVALTIGVLLIYFIVTGPVFKLMDVAPASSTEAFGIPMQQVAAVISYEGNITEEQAEFFDKILPLEVWKEKYHPYITNPLKFDENFRADFLKENKGQFIKNWLAIIVQNPKITGKAYLKQASIIWKVRPVWDSFTYTVSPGIIENNFGLEEASANQNVREFLDGVLEKTEEDNPLLFFWRPALWMYLSLLSGLLIAARTGPKSLIVLSPMVSNILAYLAAIPSQDYRYLYSNVLIAFILIPWALHLIRKKKTLADF